MNIRFEINLKKIFNDKYKSNRFSNEYLYYLKTLINNHIDIEDKQIFFEENIELLKKTVEEIHFFRKKHFFSYSPQVNLVFLSPTLMPAVAITLKIYSRYFVKNKYTLTN